MLWSFALFVIVIRYKVPLAQIDSALADHRGWLDKGFNDGVFILAGPQNPRTGGVIMACNITRKDLLTRLAEDPFNRLGLSDFEIIETVVRKTDPRLEFLQG